MENTHIYDTIILGGGPAGLSAGLYAGRGKLDTLLIEKGIFGGQVSTTYEIDNYPGAEVGVTGIDLSNRMRTQAEHFGMKVIKAEVIKVDLESRVKRIETTKGEYLAKSVIIATGAKPKLAGFSGEVELTGRGVSYCATCDADFFTDLSISVIGGGDSALQEALYLARFGSKVTIIHRRKLFRASEYLIEKVKDNPKIEFILDSVVEQTISRNGVLVGLEIKNVITQNKTLHMTDGVFVFVGYKPITDLFKGQLEMSDLGELKVNSSMETNIPGVYAAGDVRETSIRQIITSASDGAVAAINCEKYLESIM